MLSCGKTSCVQFLNKLLVPRAESAAGNSACSGQSLSRFVWKVFSWSRWAWCACSTKTVGLYLPLPSSAPALHLLRCFFGVSESVPVPKARESLQRMAWEEQFDQLWEQSSVISRYMRRSMGRAGLVLSPFTLPLPWNSDIGNIFLMCLLIIPCGGCRFFKSLGLLVYLVIYLCRQHLAFDLDNNMQCRLRLPCCSNLSLERFG